MGPILIRVKDERKQPFHVVDKLVTWFWLPFIGQTGYTLYNLYISLVNYETKGAYPSIRKVASFLDVSENTVRKYNRLLAKYGLIRIEQRLNPENGGQVSHMYYVLDPPPLSEDLEKEYERRRLVDSRLLRIRRLAEGVTDPEEMQSVPVSPDVEIPPLQSLKGGLHSLNQGVQSMRGQVQPMNQPSSTDAGANKDNKEKNRKNNNTAPSPLNVVVIEKQKQLRTILQEMEIHARTAERLVRTHNNEHIESLYQYLLYRIGQGRGPENPAAWLVAAITDDYQISEKQTGRVIRESHEREQTQMQLLEQTVEQIKEREREAFEKQQAARRQELGVTAEMEQIWKATLKELRQREKWSPVFELAFLESIEGEEAKLRVEAEVGRRVMEKNEHYQALRQALRVVLGRTVYLTITDE
jgi:hypothetical protein